MFFGKSKPEEAKLDKLDPLLVELFEKKMGQFELRSRNTIRNIEQDRTSFIDACDTLEKLDVQPYTEDIYFANITSIKNQKSLYAKTIKKIITELNLQAEGATSFERSKYVLSKIDDATNEMLKANAGFKVVLYSYSNHLGAFKRAFSGLERTRDNLRKEIDSRGLEAREYYDVKEGISKLRVTIDEIRIFKESINSLDRNLNATDRKESESAEEKMIKELDDKKRELSEVSASASKVSERISVLTMPLERSARKQDHLSLKKVNLSDFIIDPISKIKNEDSYREFATLLKEMKENVESGKIDTKNKEGTLSSISSLMDFDIYGAINSLNSLQEKKAGISEEIRTLERVISDIRKGKEGLDKSMKDIAFMKERSEAAEKSLISIKASIEKMFSDYYRKNISILL